MRPNLDDESHWAVLVGSVLNVGLAVEAWAWDRVYLHLLV